VERLRLFEVLDSARETRRAICVVGPPGAGKTTLVASWLDGRGAKGIWYQVDAGDGDLPAFFHYLGQAAAPHARRGQAPLPALTAEYLADVQGSSRRFFRALFERLPEEAVVVLDNYQEVEPASALQRLVADAVEELPEGLVLVVISRRDPPDRYARLVANEGVALLDWEQLKLTPEESRAIVQRRLPGRIAEAALLHERSGGWAAGLTLIMEARRRATSLGETPAGDRDVFAYFAGQVFDRLPARTQSFLLKTSLLPQIPQSIAQALTGDEGAGEILEDLHRRHLFIHRRPGVEPVYWYHALFREFLEARASVLLEETQRSDLLRRAARLLEARESHDEAYDLFRHAGDWAAIARLAERQGAALLRSGRHRTLQGWIRALPAIELESSPWLRYWLGCSLAPTDASGARCELEIAHERFGAVQDYVGRALAAAGILDAIVFEWADFRESRRWVEILDAELDQLHFAGDPRFEQRILCSLLLAMFYAVPENPRLPGLVKRVTEILDEALEASEKLEAAMVLLVYANFSTDMTTARIAVRCGSALSSRADISPLARVWWQIRRGLHLLNAGRYEDAMSELDSAEAVAREHGFDRTMAIRCVIPNCRMMCSAAMNDPRATRVHGERLLEVADTTRPVGRFQAVFARVYLAWTSGDAEAAAALGVEAVSAGRDSGMVNLELVNRTNCLLALAANGNDAAFSAELAEQRRRLTGTCFESYRLECDFMESWRLFKAGDRILGGARLKAALSRSRETGCQHNSLFRSSTMFAELLYEAVVGDIESRHAAHLARKMQLRPPADADHRWPWAVCIRTLGAFEVLVNGDPLRFRGKIPRKPLAPLKAVIALGGAGISVPVSRLTDTLWPEEAGDTARKALDVTIIRLRKLLGNPAVLTLAGESVSLGRRLCWVDAHYFIEATGAKAGRMEEPCSIYRGRFLPGDEDVAWIAPRRELLRNRFADAIERVAAAAESSGQWREALGFYRRGIEADELAESFHQGVMRCLLAMERPAEAASEYRRLRQLLSVVLGIAPSASSRELARRAGIESVGDR
jgi:DNA-binding SARP family transcriptional activator